MKKSILLLFVFVTYFAIGQNNTVTKPEVTKIADIVNTPGNYSG